MGLGLPTGGGGDFVTYCKYNAKAGRWYTKDDSGDEYEIEKFKAYFDFKNIQTGIFKFEAGQAPEKIFDTEVGAGDAVGEGNFKRGFLLNVFSPKIGGLREFSSTAGAVNNEMNTLYDEYLKSDEGKAGKLPLVECVKVNPVDSKHGTNFAPELKITKWGDRPKEFDELAATPAPTPAPAKASSDDAVEDWD